MSNEEFSNEFDILLNSQALLHTYAKGEKPIPIQLNEYEKSVLLTQAQENIVKNLYSGNNSKGLHFESNEETRASLSNLIKTYRTDEPLINKGGINSTSIYYGLPDDVWLKTYEVAYGHKDGSPIKSMELLVKPTTQDKFFKAKRNPFRTASESRVLRLDLNDQEIELYSIYTIDEYVLRYLSKPSPIILDDLDPGLMINGVSTSSVCLLNSIIHRDILNEAVRLALITKTIYNNKNNNQQN